MKVVCTSPSFAKYSDDPVLFLEKKGMSLERLPADITEEQFIEAKRRSGCRDRGV
nr:hypothetical protein [Bacillus licheniformis]MDH3161747.1 hypothetical protein [Bacillus licheniformis]